MRIVNTPEGDLLDLVPDLRELFTRHFAALADTDQGTPLLAALPARRNADPLAAWESDEVADEVARVASERIIAGAVVGHAVLTHPDRPLTADARTAMAAAANYFYINGLAPDGTVGRGQEVPDGISEEELRLLATQPTRMLFAALATLLLSGRTW